MRQVEFYGHISIIRASGSIDNHWCWINPSLFTMIYVSSLRAAIA